MAEWRETQIGLLPKDWDIVLTTQFCSRVADGTHDSPKPQEEGRHLITSKHIVGRKLDLEKAYRITDSEYEKINERSKVDKWDVLLTMIGTVGEVFLVDEEPNYAIKNIGLFKLGGNEKKARWLYNFFRSKAGQAEIKERAAGTTQEYISLGDLRTLYLPVPPENELNCINGIFSSLDDKIDLLHRQNKTLEALAETLFRQWFIEEVEDGWERCKLLDLVNHLKDSINPMKDPEKDYYHYSIPAFDSGREPVRQRGQEIRSNKYKVFSNSILISKLNPKTPRLWPIFGDVDEDNSICSTEFQVVQPKRHDHFGFIYCFLKSSDVTNELASAVGGTSGSHQRVDPQVIFDMTFAYPAIQRVVDFDDLTNHFWKKIRANKAEILTLMQLRDTLLPKLMSGEVRVRH